MEDRDSNYGVVGYCFRMSTMHRNGKPFIKKGSLQEGKKRILESFEGGFKGGDFFEKSPSLSSVRKDAGNQMELEF
jgi:hypothetical protein